MKWVHHSPPSPLQVLMGTTRVWPVCLKETPDSPKPRPPAFEKHSALVRVQQRRPAFRTSCWNLPVAPSSGSCPRPQCRQSGHRAICLPSTHTSPHSFLAAPEGDLQPFLVCRLRGGSIRDSKVPLKLRKYRGLAVPPMPRRPGPTGLPGAD